MDRLSQRATRRRYFLCIQAKHLSTCHRLFDFDILGPGDCLRVFQVLLGITGFMPLFRKKIRNTFESYPLSSWTSFGHRFGLP